MSQNQSLSDAEDGCREFQMVVGTTEKIKKKDKECQGWEKEAGWTICRSHKKELTEKTTLELKTLEHEGVESQSSWQC